MALNNLGLGFLITAKDAASAVFSQVGNAMQGLSGKGAQLTQSLDQAWDRIGQAGQKMHDVGMAGLSFLGRATDASNKFETAIAKISTIANQTEFPVTRLRDIVMSMSQQFGGDLETQAAALYTAIGSGAEKAADAVAVLEASNKLAIGGLVSVDVAMNGLMGTLNAYGMSLTRATEVSDMFFAAVRLGGSDMGVGKLSEGIGRVAPTAAVLKVSIADLTATIAALTASGIKTDEAITGMKAVFDQIIKPTSKAAAEAKRLGIEFNSAALRSKGFERFMMDIINNPKLAADSMELLFGSSTEALNAVNVMAAGGGAKFLDFIKQVRGSAGATDSAFKTLAQTGEFAATVLKSNLQIALVKIGDVLAPILGYMLQIINKLVVAFNNLPAPLRKLLVGGTAIGSILLVVAGTILTTVAAVAALAAAFAAVGWEVILIAAAAVVAVMQYVGAAFVAAAGVAYGFYTAIQKNLGGFGTWFQSVFGQASGALTAFQGLMEGNGKLTGDAATAYLGLGDGVKNAITTIWLYWERLKAFVSGISAGFSTGMDALAPAFQSLVTSLQALGAALGFSKSSAEDNASAYEQFEQVGRTVGQGLATVFGLIVQGVQIVVDVWTGLVSGFKAMGPVIGVLGGAFGLLIDSFGQLLGAFGSADVAGEKNRSGWQTLGAVIGAVGAIFAYVIAAIVYAVSILVGVAGSVVSGIVSIFSGIVSVVMGVWTFLRGLFTGDWPTMWQGLAMVVFGVVQAIVGAVTAMVSSIASIIDSLGKAFGKDLGIKAAVEGAKVDMMRDLGGALGLPPQPSGRPAPAAAPTPARPTALPAEPMQPALAPAAPGGAPPAAPTIPGMGAPSPAMGMFPAAPAAPAPVVVNPQPVNVTSNIRLEVDGATLAEVVDRHSTSTSNRSFGPSPTSTG